MDSGDEMLFLFDLDSTITKVEILPTIAEEIGKGTEMRELTEKGMYQAVPFRQSFLDRVALLEKLSVSKVAKQIAEIPIHEHIARFLSENKERCYIVTGNLDVWIEGLIQRMGMMDHVFCSKGIVKNDRLVGVASVIDKNATVGQFVGEFAAIGDGSNDAEMISRAKIGIGFGGVRPIAPSVLEVCSHAFYDEEKLVDFLERLAGHTTPKPGSKTIVISCAGMGKRLGIGTTKCLLDIEGKPLITRHLDLLQEAEDVRVVVGYQAEKVLDTVTSFRKDVTFVFNHDYAHNGTGASVSLASKYANESVLTVDGDLLVHPSDMARILAEKDEFIGVTAPGTDNPVLTVNDNGMVTKFSREEGSFEWTGISQIKSTNLVHGDGHVYQLIEHLLPIRYLFLRTKEIDTQNDYDKALRWVRNGYSDEVVIGIVGGMGTYATINLFQRLADAVKAEKEWERPRIIIDNNCTMPSRVRAVIYGERRAELVEMLAKSTNVLIEAGCTHILYACNTSHVFHDDVCALVPNARDYLIDMIDLLGRDMVNAKVDEAYLLASEGTIQSGIFQERFFPYGIRVIEADSKNQTILRSFIESVKQNRVTEQTIKQFLDFLKSIGAENIILGCTELPVLYQYLEISGMGLPSNIRLFDPLQSAIDELSNAFNSSRAIESFRA